MTRPRHRGEAFVRFCAPPRQNESFHGALNSDLGPWNELFVCANSPDEAAALEERMLEKRRFCEPNMVWFGVLARRMI